MDIVNIEKVVESFVDSIYPSISEILLLLLILVILLGIKRSIALVRLMLMKSRRINVSPIKKLEEVFDTKKFRSLIVIFLFLLFARSVHLFAYQVGTIIPGKLSYSQPDLLLKSASNDEILRVWSFYPKSKDLLSLDTILGIEIQKAELAAIPYIQSSYVYHKNRLNSLVRNATYMKFMVVYIMVAAFYFSSRNRICQISFRAVLLILLMLLLISYRLLQSMQEYQQINIAAIHGVTYIREYESKNDEKEMSDVDMQKFLSIMEQNRRYEMSPFSLSLDWNI